MPLPSAGVKCTLTFRQLHGPIVKRTRGGSLEEVKIDFDYVYVCMYVSIYPSIN